MVCASTIDLIAIRTPKSIIVSVVITMQRADTYGGGESAEAGGDGAGGGSLGQERTFRRKGLTDAGGVM